MQRYVQPSSPRVSSFDRSSARPRRPSDQDVALPSVEPETIDLTSPRRITAYQQPIQNQDVPTRPHDDVQGSKRKVSSFPVGDERSYAKPYTKRPWPPVYREEAYSRTYQNGPPAFRSNQQTGHYSGSRGPPPEYVSDVTAGLDGRGRPLPPRSITTAFPRGREYLPEASAGRPSHSYVPDGRPYERRAPAYDYILFQDGRQPPPANGDDKRYTRNGARYGG